MVFRTFLPLALLLAPAPLFAQGMVQPLNQTDADRLAEQVRRLGADPRNVDALLTAAELSIRLDDLSAAGAFLARAEKVMPSGGRGAAIRGAILVRSERPGEALRQFALAEGQGWPSFRFAADRGLAYDLTGEQRRAQTDYRLALKTGDDGEVRRRLALSLGIAGKNRDALDELAPLVRSNDRAAWRARAFILAMSGNATEALGIAQTMMPPGSAQGLRGFFAELPGLPAIDRAFAVHFGEVRATPQRLADARLAPQLAPLPPEVAPVQVAAVQPIAAPSRDRGRRKKEKVGRTAITYTPVQVAAAEPLPAPPAYRVPTYTTPSYQPPSRAQTYTAADRPLTAGEQASLAAATLPSARRRGREPVSVVTPAASPSRPVGVAVVQPQPSTAPATVATAVRAPVVAPVVSSPTPAASGVGPTSPPVALAAATPAPVSPPVAGEVSLATNVPTPGFSALPTAPDATVLAASAPAPASAETVEPTPAPERAIAAVTVAPITAAPSPSPAVTPPPRLSRARADDILAKIVANLSIPASELGVNAPASGTRLSRTATRLAAKKPEVETAEDRAAVKPVGRRTASARKAEADAKALADGTDDAPATKAAGKKALADKKDDPQAAKLAARKALADKKAAAEKKALADKAAAEKKASRAEPTRIWVQVAGGANEGDLNKAWKSVQAKAPAAFAGRKGYTTPLRATNRVLTGPFKTDAEARAYVNQLAKSGVSAFAFTSDAGQKVSRLGEK